MASTASDPRPAPYCSFKRCTGRRMVYESKCKWCGERLAQCDLDHGELHITMEHRMYCSSAPVGA